MDAAPAAPPAPVPPPGVGRIEGRLGGAWLSRVGALVLILGVGFFLEHAFDSGWIAPPGRVATGLVAGLGCLLAGARLQRAASRVPAQGLAAVGIATLYLTAYAAHALYALVPLLAALASVALVTAVGAAIAVRHDARAIAALAALGGLLAPVVLEAEAALPLFVYLGVLDAGLLVTASRRGWRELPLLGLAATHLAYWGWLWSDEGAARLPLALGAATGFFLLFAAFAWAARRGVPRLVVLAAPTLFVLAARQALGPERADWLFLLCLALAGMYALAGRQARRMRDDRPALAVLHHAVALGLLTLAFAVRLDDRGVAIAWSVLSAVLLWGGLRVESPGLRAGALGLFVLAWLRWAASAASPAAYDGRLLLDHPAALVTAAVAGAALAMAGLYARVDREWGAWEARARPLLLLLAVGSAAVLVADAVSPLGPLRVAPAVHRVLRTMVWTVAALPLLALARGDRTRLLLTGTSAVLLVAALATVGPDAAAWPAVPARLRAPVLNPRFLAGLLVVVASGLYARVVPEFPHLGARARARLGATAAAAAVLLLLWNASAEVWLSPLEGVPSADAASVRQVGLSVLWTVSAFVAMGVGLRRGHARLRRFALGLFGVTVAKVLLVDLGALAPGYRILSFVVLGTLLILASFLHGRHRERSAQAGGG